VEDLGLLLLFAFLVLLIYGWGRLLTGAWRHIREPRSEKTQLKRAAEGLQADAPGILARVEKGDDLAGIPAAFPLLLSDDPNLRLRAARTIAQRIGRVPIGQLAKLDPLFRQQTSLEWDLRRIRKSPADLFAPSLTEGERTAVLGLASFHPDGHFREKAVKMLARIRTGAELPYLVIRLNDWVPVIWNRSHAAIRDRLRQENARAIVGALPLIFRLRGRSRRNHHDLVLSAIAILSGPRARPELEIGLRSKDPQIRRCCYQAIVEAKAFDRPALLEHLLRDPLPAIRSFGLRLISPDLTLEEIRPYRSALLSDRSAAVRLSALRMLHRFDQAESIAELERAVSDEDPAVREAARYLVKDRDGARDLAAHYRELLQGRPAVCPGSISGLGETGRADDAKYVRPFLEAEDPRLVRSAMRAVAKLDFDGSKDTLIAFLADARPGIVKEARRLLRGRIDTADAESIHRDHFLNKSDAMRRQTAFLLCSLGKWDALRYIVEICADRSEPVEEIGRSALSLWLQRFNRSFAAPSWAQIEAIRGALREFGHALPEETGRLIEFTVRSFLTGEIGSQVLEARARPGVVDLRDLTTRFAGKPLAIDRVLEAAKLSPRGPASVAFAPPRVVIAVVPVDDPGLLRRSRAWLEDAARIIVLRAWEDFSAGGDRDLEEAVRSEWKNALAAIGVPIELVDWRRDEDVKAAIERAVARSKATEPAPAPAAPPTIVEHAPGPRIPIDSLPGGWLEAIAAHLVPSPERVVLFAGGDAVDLSDASAVIRFAESDLHGAVSPQGRRLSFENKSWRIDGQPFEASGYLALGFDAHHPVGWTGHRQEPFWLYSGKHGTGFLSACDLDYPCGPARKLYGYADNDPVGVSLAPDLGAVAYHFDHDVLVTSAIPIPWREAGPVLVADFPRDPSRALFFAKTPDIRHADDLLDEDARDLAPDLVLGPTAEARYAVDLTHAVYRVTCVEPWVGAVARIGGPGEGFAVFDQAHREVRRGSGRLLGGWWRWATVLDAGAYWREDLATGERRRIADAEVMLPVAFGVPWTKNVVLHFEEAARWWIRLI